MTHKGPRANISTDGRAIIAARALEWPRLNLDAVVEKILRDFNDKGYKLPQPETLKKWISHHRTHAESVPEEKPWSTATLDKYPIDTYALAWVLRVWKFRTNNNDSLTIREAQWVARLCKYLSEQDHLQGDKVALISSQASTYARTEIIYHIVKRPFDSTELDRAITGLPVSITRDLKTFYWLFAGTKADPVRGMDDGIQQAVELSKEQEKESSDRDTKRANGGGTQ